MVDINEFWRRATQCGLVPLQTTAQIESALRDTTGQTVSPTTLADFLQTHGRITAYQRDALLAEPEGTLRFGDFLIQDVETPPPLSKWIAVRNMASNPQTTGLQTTGLQTTGLQTIGFLIRTAAGNPSLSQHASVTHPGLQNFCVQPNGDDAIVFSPLVIASRQPPAASTSQISQWAQTARSAVAALHDAGLIHGSIAADRFVWDADGQPRLLRDPSGAADPANGFLDAGSSDAGNPLPAPSRQNDQQSLARVIATWLPSHDDALQTIAAEKPAVAAEPPAVVSKPREKIPPPPTPAAVPDPPAETPPKPQPTKPQPQPQSAKPESPAPRVVVRRKRSLTAPLVLLSMLGVVVCQVIYLIAVPVTATVRTRPRSETPNNASSRTPNRFPDLAMPATPTPPPAAYQIVDDKSLLYVPPEKQTDAAETMSLADFPPGASMFVQFRPRRWLASKNQSIIADTLGDDGTRWIEQILSVTGVPAESIDTIVGALYAERGQRSNLIRFELQTPLPSVPDTWTAVQTDPPLIYTVAGIDDVQIADLGDGRYLAGTQAMLRGGLARDGGDAPLPRPMERVHRKIRGDADFAMLVNPNFLFTDGRDWLRDTVPSWSDPLRGFLVPDIAVLSLSMQLADDAIYVETRMIPAGVATPIDLVGSTRNTLARWTQSAATASSVADVEPAWQPITDAYPAMTAFINDRIRVGVDDGLVTANVYVPTHAVPQITLASLIVANAAAKSTAPAPRMDVPQTIDEFLAITIDVDIPQESLKASLDTVRVAVVDQLPRNTDVPAFEIVGRDLQQNGITQNQQIRDFKQSANPLSDVLTALCQAANPDKTVTSPSDPKQALVWVKRDGKILITTRDAVATNGDELPSAFQAEP